MLRIVCLFFLFHVLNSDLIAQDVIYQRDNTKQIGKIVEVSSEYVRFIPSINPGGPVYALPWTEIFLIVYENGSYETQSSMEGKEYYSVTNFIDSIYRKNSLGLSVYALLFNNISLTYQRIFCSGYLSFDLPVSVGISSRNYELNDAVYSSRPMYYSTYARSRVFSIQANLNFYPTGIREFITFYIGSGVHWGAFKLFSVYNYPDYDDNIAKYINGQRLAFIINNGLLVSVNEYMKFNLFISTGTGIDESNMPGEKFARIIMGGFNASFAFRNK